MTLTEEQIRQIAEKHTSGTFQLADVDEICAAIREALELAEKGNAEALRSHEAMKVLEEMVRERTHIRFGEGFAGIGVNVFVQTFDGNDYRGDKMFSAPNLISAIESVKEE